MSSISFDEFTRVLRTLNPQLRVFPSKTKRSSMIYQRAAYHPDTGQYGLNEVFAFPSPSHGSFPKYDFLDKAGLPGRGYTTVFKMLVRRKLVSKELLRALLPQALDGSRGRPTRRVEKDEKLPPVPVYSNAVVNTGVRLRARRPPTA